MSSSRTSSMGTSPRGRLCCGLPCWGPDAHSGTQSPCKDVPVRKPHPQKRTSSVRTSSTGTSLCGHHVLDGDVLGGDVLGGDVLDEDVLGGDIVSTQGRPRADVPVEDFYVCFYFCPFVNQGLQFTVFPASQQKSFWTQLGSLVLATSHKKFDLGRSP